MTSDMIPIIEVTNELGLVQIQPLDQNPALVYLAGLNSDRRRRVQRQALEVIAETLTGAPDLQDALIRSV